jgi:hypothetical protein
MLQFICICIVPLFLKKNPFFDSGRLLYNLELEIKLFFILGPKKLRIYESKE